MSASIIGAHAVSADEIFVTVAAILLGPVAWLVWLFTLWRLPRLRHKRAGIPAIAVTLAACALVIYGVLRTAASFDVVNAPQYVAMYVVLGLAWLRVVETSFAFFGVSVRDDVVERGNEAAEAALVGALVGVTLCYAGANVGDGPGWWVVVFAAALATGTWLLVWFTLVFFSPIADTVAIDRDPAAGLRLGAVLAACGLIMGRGVAGDWVSADATVNDFVMALPPVVPILVMALVIEHRARSTPERPHAPLMTWGLLPAAAYLAVAVAAVVRAGLP